MQAFVRDIWIGWHEVFVGIAGGAGIYLLVILLVRLYGQRCLTSIASYDFPVTIAIGAIIGRTAVAKTSLGGGLVALVTLFSLQALVGYVRDHATFGGGIDPRAVVVMVAGTILDDGLRRAHLSRRDIYQRLRRAGVSRLAEVRLMVLERDGSLSVITGDALDEELVSDIVDPWARRACSTEPTETAANRSP